MSATRPGMIVHINLRVPEGAEPVTEKVTGIASSLPGLALTPAGRSWRITHLASGHAVAFPRASEVAESRWRTADEAEAAAVEWLSGCDWTRSADEIAADVAARWAARSMLGER